MMWVFPVLEVCPAMSSSVPTVHLLFLCAKNHARSLMAEALLNHLSHGRFRAFSAGTGVRADCPAHPMVFEVLDGAGIHTQGLEPKSIQTFQSADAPHIDLVITLCDTTKGELEPEWPGHPACAHWHYPDPADVTSSEEATHDAFKQTLMLMGRRIELLLSLPPERLARASLPDAARSVADAAH